MPCKFIMIGSIKVSIGLKHSWVFRIASPRIFIHVCLCKSSSSGCLLGHYMIHGAGP
jgi:hypothetical protein